jgi:branched-chain amino acid transport system ATP-binding protein
MSPLLSVEDVWVRRGQAEVLRGMSFKVSEGEVVALLGSNGAGKSTSLRTISGLHHPHLGTITFDGAPVGGRAPRQMVRAGISHVPEGRLLFPSLTVLENLEMGAYIKGSPSKKDVDKVVGMLPAVVRSMLHKRAGSLSGGQQQMVTIARGLMSAPRLLMLDEPSLGLAPEAVKAVGRLIEQLKSERMTMLLVEQNAAIALQAADRGYVVVQGRVELAGTSAELSSNEGVRRAYLGV